TPRGGEERRSTECVELGSSKTPIDENIAHEHPLINDEHAELDTIVYKGPLTQARKKQLQHEVNLFLNDCEHVPPKNHVLPNGCSLPVLKFEAQVARVKLSPDPISTRSGKHPASPMEVEAAEGSSSARFTPANLKRKKQADSQYEMRQRELPAEK
ncbi:hypothetical protein EJB05_03359, partial [Eragrostis curvula]